MTAVEQQALKNKNREQTAVEQAPKKRRPRGKDNGPIVLPHLEHFIQMTRKVKRPSLIGRLLEGCAGCTLPALRALTDAAKEGLSIPLRDALFTAVAELDPPHKREWSAQPNGCTYFRTSTVRSRSANPARHE